MNARHIDIDPATLSRLPVFRTRSGAKVLSSYDRIDRAIVGFLDEWGLTLLRIALGVVFLWFGALKVFDRSPVADLVAETVYWLPADPFVRVLGGVEILIGIGLLTGIGLRVILAIFFAQMAGTFLVLVMKPGESFQDGNPLLLTVLGEFVIKNLVLITAGLVLGASARSKNERISSIEPPTEGRPEP